MRLFLFVLLLGCSENRFLSIREKPQEDTAVMADEDSDASEPSQPSNEPSQPSQPSAEPTYEPAFEPSQPSSEPTNEPDNSNTGMGSSMNDPIMAGVGDIVINELMIQPNNADAESEWVELKNLTNLWVDLRGLRLMDNGVDNYVVQEVYLGSMIVPPNGFVVICANTNFWDNGGVDCRGKVLYQCFGGGFCLSDGEDEVILKTVDNVFLDRFDYPTGFAEAGTSMGVKPSAATPTGNDNLNNWCDQFSSLPMGDYGSPNAENFNCF